MVLDKMWGPSCTPVFKDGPNECFCQFMESIFNKFIDNGRSFIIKIVNSYGPRTLPWGIPEVTSDQFEHTPLHITLLPV